MKHLSSLYIVLPLMAMVSSACSGSDTLGAADADAVVHAATRDARAVADARPGSMQQENAVLAIRAKESELRMNGYDLAADLYEQTACSLLVQQRILDPQCLSISPK